MDLVVVTQKVEPGLEEHNEGGVPGAGHPVVDPVAERLGQKQMELSGGGLREGELAYQGKIERGILRGRIRRGVGGDCVGHPGSLGWLDLITDPRRELTHRSS